MKPRGNLGKISPRAPQTYDLYTLVLDSPRISWDVPISMAYNTNGLKPYTRTLTSGIKHGYLPVRLINRLRRGPHVYSVIVCKPIGFLFVSLERSSRFENRAINTVRNVSSSGYRVVIVLLSA